ncbi:MAG: hypothetical protein R3F56_09870 [Planctomycetota bacterium]
MSEIPGEAVPADVAPSGHDHLPFAERVSDRVNPIFLREMQQAFNARSFLGVIGVVLAAILLIGLMVALGADRAFEGGRQVFIPVMMVLVPVMTMVLPMQAFNSMQHELREGAVDQLLMSELTPGRIVRGKMMAAGLLALIFVAVFAPMLAVTYLLRGIDVGTIVICIGFTLLFALAASSVGIAMGAVTLIKPLQHLARLGVSLALAGLTIGVMGSLYQVVRELSGMRSSDVEGMIATAAALVVGIVLMNLVAAAVLTHPYENRSTSFRVFPFAVTGIAYAMAWWLAPRDVPEFAAVWTLVASAGAVPFYLGALTEERTLSPRVRTLVPKNRLLALLSVPFLPGSDRGLWFVLLFLATLGASFLAASVVPTLVVPDVVAFAAAGALNYVWIWACVLRWARGQARGQRARIRALAVTLALLALACAGPAIYDLAASGEVDTWGWHHLLNPFFTMGSEFRRHILGSGSGDGRWWEILTALASISAVLLLLRAPGLVRGVREVLEASRARRG